MRQDGGKWEGVGEGGGGGEKVELDAQRQYVVIGSLALLFLF